MVDVGRDDGAAARDFVAHEFRRDEGRHRGAEALAVGKRGFRALEHLLAAEVFAVGDVDHFLGDDAGAGEFVLRDGLAAERRAAASACSGSCARRCLPETLPLSSGLIVAAVIFLDAAALLHPGDARARQALLDVDRHVRIGVGPGGVVDRQRRLAGLASARSRAAARAGRAPVGRGIDLARGRQRAGGDLRGDQIGGGDRLVHRGRSQLGVTRARAVEGRHDGRKGPCPFAGMTRIRFKGSPRRPVICWSPGLAVSQLPDRSSPRKRPPM